MPVCIFLGEGSPTKIDHTKKSGTLILTSPLEDLGHDGAWALDEGQAAPHMLPHM